MAAYKASPIELEPYGETRSGLAVSKITLTNAEGMSAEVLSYGAKLASLKVRDAGGKLGEVTLGFDSLREYEDRSPYFGATIGRVANRIAKGVFSLENRKVVLALNNGANHLHGGFQGYDKRVWEPQCGMTSDGPSVRLTLLDPDGSEGYPGNVSVSVIYTVTETNSLKIQYFAVSDKLTPINLTNHAYWNLKDGGATHVLSHELQVQADAYLPVDSGLIPTGEIALVAGTAMDFTSSKSIGQDLDAMGGFDHNFVLRRKSEGLLKVAEVFEPDTRRLMELWTTEPGLQFYSGNFLDGSIVGRAGTVYGKYHGFCLETQHFPDSVNRPEFPGIVQMPGATYRQITEYRFHTS